MVSLARCIATVAVACVVAGGAHALEVDADPSVLPPVLTRPFGAVVEGTQATVTEAAAAETESSRIGRVRELQRGIASWYGQRFHGRRTASGETYDMHALTAAHPTLPFGTIVRVRSLVNGREVDVRINDRGPHIRRRIIDLSRGAAQALGLLEAGTGTKPVVLSVPDAIRQAQPLSRRGKSTTATRH
jgi:rare lipoprotein A